MENKNINLLKQWITWKIYICNWFFLFPTVDTFCSACAHRQAMEFGDEQSGGPTPAPLSESPIPARVPQLVLWRWRPHTHWFRCSVPFRAKSQAADGGLLDTGWAEDGQRGCWPSQTRLGAPGCSSAALGPGRPAATPAAAVPAADPGRHAFIRKWFKFFLHTICFYE